MAYSQSALSTEHVRIAVAAKMQGAVYDPTGDTVQMAFIQGDGSPSSADWHTASWEVNGTTYYACCLVGPTGGTILPASPVPYTAWVKVTDNPEVPVRPAGQLWIT